MAYHISWRRKRILSRMDDQTLSGVRQKALSPRRQARGYKHTHSSIADSNDDFLQIIFVVQRLGPVAL